MVVRPELAGGALRAEDVKLAEAVAVHPPLVGGVLACGYRLKESFPGEYDKENFYAIGEIVKRLVQAGRLPFHWVADASAVTYGVASDSSGADFLRRAHRLYERDRRDGQPIVVEVYAEARETLPLISRVARERGVQVYSGGGSSGPHLAHSVARRAVERAARRGQETLVLGLSDFDQAGIRNILRPHVEHLSAFLYATAGNDRVVAVRAKGKWFSMADRSDLTAEFLHLALTPEMVLDLVEDERDREQIEAYMASAKTLWSRDLDLLADVQKIEMEALDPVDLRNLVVNAIESVIVAEAMNRVGAEEEVEKQALAERLGELANQLDGEAA